MNLYSLKLNNNLIEIVKTDNSETVIRSYRDRIPTKVKELAEMALDSNSILYKYRQVNKALIECAVDIVNSVISTAKEKEAELDDLYRMGGYTESTYNWMKKANKSFQLEGYSNARLTNITYKVAAILSILSKNRGTYNLSMYYRVVDKDARGTFKYKDVTFLPSDELKRICGEHSGSDYLAIKYALIASGSIKEISEKYYYSEDDYDPITGAIIEGAPGIAKAIWVNPEILDKIYNTSESILIPGGPIYEGTINQLKSAPTSYLYSIVNLLKFDVTEDLYKCALNRIVSNVHSEVAMGDEEKEDPELIYRNSMPYTLTKRFEDVDGKGRPVRGTTQYTVELTTQIANVIVAMYEFDVFTILRYSIDDYSGRLHTIITRLSKYVRNFVTWNDGSSISNVDIRSCQPMILCGLLAKDGYPEISRKVDGKDFYQFMAEVELGREIDLIEYKHFYKYTRPEYKNLFMSAAYGLGKEHDRFISILAKIVATERTDEAEGEKFKAYFNELIDGTSERNKREGFETKQRKREYDNGHIDVYLPSALPKRMQSMEVNIMFGEGGVIETLVDKGIEDFTTIHDSIIVRKDDAITVKGAMEKVFSDHLSTTECYSKITANIEDYDR